MRKKDPAELTRATDAQDGGVDRANPARMGGAAGPGPASRRAGRRGIVEAAHDGVASRRPLLGFALFAAVAVAPVHAQGLAAQARIEPPDSTEEISRLRLQVETLEHRVAELERQRLELLKDKAAEAAERAADQATAAAVEQRLASLEKAQQAAKSAGEKGKPPADGEEPLTVVAPFVVKDRHGKVIMVVQEGGGKGEVPGGSRGLYIYGLDQSGGALAHVGAMSDEEVGRIYVTHGGARRPDIVMAYDAGPVLVLNTGTSGRVATLDKHGFVYFNPSGHPAAEVRSKDGRGLLLLNGPDGSHMVEAGSLASGKGYVLVNPWQSRTDLAGDPSVLMGGKAP